MASHGNMDRSKEPVAVIGSGCRFPGQVTTPSKLWTLLREPRDLLTSIPPERFSASRFYHEDGQYHGHSNVDSSYFLHGENTHRHFDAYFFGISPIEAHAIDPQARLLLEVVYEGLESAGQTIDALKGTNTGCYVGLMTSDYEQILGRDMENIAKYHVTGNARSLMSNRISYFFDWHGPSMTIDTACSSSLIAVHQAVQLLRSGDARVSVAAGSNLLLDPQNYVTESKLQMLSPDSRSRMWDADANGYARGEGVAAVVLKLLSVAEADGDHIECVIRETGINQDGRTKGITMPNASAQADLIRSCYTKAGLDVNNPTERCQYFECHGTGTKAGDKTEAEAISNTFFAHNKRSPEEIQLSKLLVGSIKTVIGHSEGTAGLAALLKTSLALQQAMIPPNLLFNRLNPEITPFYTNLQIPVSFQPWPCVRVGQPRRASVNSFGFGGANAHAILESYQPNFTTTGNSNASQVSNFMPFVFSAATQSSLSSYIAAFSEFLKQQKASINLRDLAYTLSSRRTRLTTTAYFVAQNIDELCTKLDRSLQETGSLAASPNLGLAPQNPRIIGVFTGQGAQWARMGANLITESPTARGIIEALDRRISRLPSAHQPDWTILGELLKDESSSQVAKAHVSQPLCTAVQIMLVDILRSSGIRFSTVVGHSSGEISAAYAAGIISADDAVCIAYYRGLYSHLACGSDGKRGAMIAVGTSRDDAEELCSTAEFEGRVSIAACNSSSSVTLSGDEDAIEEMRIIFEDEQKFVRRLKVETAYHSHHMNACLESYRDALQSLDIKLSPRPSCTWVSSVFGGDVMHGQQFLKGKYWERNLTSPVLFSQSIASAIETSGPFDIAIEVGPHPSLKGPTLQTNQDSIGQLLPYTGLLRRNQNDIDSFSQGLGYAWERLSTTVVNLEACDRFLSGGLQAKFVNGLPTYCWQHDKEYWHESRYSKSIRNHRGGVHELLGHLTPDSTKVELRWRHVLCPREISWLTGHQLQGQIVFPAAGYISLAVEASLSFARDEPVQVVEILDLDICQALTFDEENSTVETLFSLSDMQPPNRGFIHGTFKYYSYAEKRGTSLELVLMARGNICMRLGVPSKTILAPRSQPASNMISVEPHQHYSSLERLGYQYTGPFYGLFDLKRKLGATTSSLLKVERSSLLIHPATLDSAFQSILLAHCFPGDGRLWSLHVPKKIQRVTINPFLCTSSGNLLHLDATQSYNDAPGLHGDVDIYPDGQSYAMAQVEGLECIPFSQSNISDDKSLFASMKWIGNLPDAEIVGNQCLATEEQHALAQLLERVSYFHLRNLDREIPENHASRSHGPYRNFFQFASHAQKQPHCKPEWAGDTHEKIKDASERFLDSIDLKFLNFIGQKYASIVRGETTAIENAMKDDLLTQLYENGLGLQVFTKHLADVVSQVTCKFPWMNVLEIGAGTGGATKQIFSKIKQNFCSYTFTDISSGFFPKAQNVFKDSSHKIVYQPLDISEDPEKQGFIEHSYDLIIASLVLHATPVLEETLKNVRRLLKPGGFLIMVEMTTTNVIRSGAIFGAFPGWWLGADDGRVLSPCIHPTDWDLALRCTGFSGCDSISPNNEPLVWPLNVIVSQAIDDRVKFLRDPLSSATFWTKKVPELHFQSLVLIGGQTTKTSRLISYLKALLVDFCQNIQIIKTLTELKTPDIILSTAIINLSELDKPLFKDLSASTFDNFKELLHNARTVVWVTEGRRAKNPYANMTLGLIRSALRELPSLNFQFLDIENCHTLDGCLFAEALLRLRALSVWQGDVAQQDLLQCIEPEMVLCKDKWMVPRLTRSKDMNERFNSSRRPIFKELDSSETRLELKHFESEYSLRQRLIYQRAESHGFNFKTTHSLMSSIKVGSCGYFFVLLGIDSNSGAHMIGLSRENCSCVSMGEELFVVCNPPPQREAELVLLFALQILASHFLKDVSPGNTIWLHESPIAFIPIIENEATKAGVVLFFTTSDPNAKRGDWVIVHNHTPARRVRQIVPRNLALFLNFSKSVDSISTLLPSSCQCETIDTLLSKVAFVKSGFAPEPLQRQTNDALDAIQPYLADAVELGSLDVLPPDSIPIDHTNELSIIDWVSQPRLSVKIAPADAETHIFSGTKTYWLVGLTGDLGLSLCEWMTSHGARYIVLTSRNPHVEPSWLDKMNNTGAVITVFSCDVTERHELVKIHLRICATLPPIVGVAQGAMVLHDTALRDMTLETLLVTTRPKVEGSIFLDEIFCKNTLDFFIFFSSMSSVMGNVGQANYSAANQFMSSLAHQRRERGLAASVINIGPVLGVGYIAREHAQAVEDSIHRGGYMCISEYDFLQLFAEGVSTGHANSDAPVEIFTALREISPEEPYKPSWLTNPIFGNYVQRGDNRDHTSNTTKVVVPLKSQIGEAKNIMELHDILVAAVTSKLCTLFQLEHEKFETKDEMSHLRLDELGIDSLLAVDIRTWFIKSLDVNIPVLKILSGVSVAELVSIAMDSLIPSLSLSWDSNAPTALKPTGSFALSEETQLPASSVLGSNDIDLTDTSEDSSISSMVASESKESSSISKLEPIVLKSTPLSFSQSLFWFIVAFSEDKTALNHTGCFRITGNIRRHDLQNAVLAVGQRHEILRTCFINSQDEVSQGIMEKGVLHLEHQQLTSESELPKVIGDIESHVYDIARGETMRLVLVSLSPRDYFLLIGCHHLVVDGSSFPILMSDLLAFYNHNYPTSMILQHSEYTRLQHEQFRNGELTAELNFWRSEYPDFPKPLPILRTSPIMSRPASKSYNIQRLDSRINSSQRTEIVSLCRQLRVTPFHFYLAAFRALLAKYTDVEDISIGIGDANRNDERVAGSIGPFVNLLPLRFDTQSMTTIESMIQETREKTFKALENSRVPFQVLLNELNAPRSNTHSPIFQCFVDYRLGAREKEKWGDCELELISFKASQTTYDLALDIIDNPNGGCLFMLMFRGDLYTFDEASLLMESYEAIIEGFLKHPDFRLDELVVYPEERVTQGVNLSHGSSYQNRWEDTIVHRVEAITENQPNSPAIRTALGTLMTYTQMAKRTNEIAALLKNYAVQNGSTVVVLQEPTPNWICSIFAIMRIGCIYVPLDLSIPESRILASITDCKSNVVLIDEDVDHHIHPMLDERLTIINVSEKPLDTSLLPNIATSKSPAMILYTSGSSGAPKGIILRHEGLVNWVEPANTTFGFSCEIVLQQSSSSFDMCYMQILMALSHGGSIYLLPRSLRADAIAISEAIVKHKITLTCATPSEYSNWLKYGRLDLLATSSSWKIALAGGEHVSSALVRQFSVLQKSGLRFFNCYGPTEVSFTATAMEIEYTATDEFKDSFFPVGRPLPNYSIYVVDEMLNFVPRGVQGEVYIGGPGVGAGYIKNTKLNHERFVLDVFSTPEDAQKGWTTMHRTGDLGRWNKQGCLLLEGRISGDTQLKIRGIRTDLRDVEYSILEASKGTITEIVVSMRQESASSPQILVAHVIFNSSYPRKERDSYLQRLPSILVLPRHMYPALFIETDGLPMTNSSKLDRRAINALPLPQKKSILGGPNRLSQRESDLLAVWEEILLRSITSMHEISSDTDFFHVGGSSLLLLKLQALVRDRYKVTIDLIEMFASSTLGSMAQILDSKTATAIFDIDWESETSLSPEILALGSTHRVSPHTRKTVILTGSTGFLGKAILEALIEDPVVENINCIAVRQPHSHLRHEKVSIFQGDLTLPLLGLSIEDKENIFSTSNLLVHNGADVSHLKSFQSLKLANLQSTKELINMALPFRIPLHYISTTQIGSYCEETILSEISLSNVSPPPSGSDGYTASKWCSEHFLQKLNRHCNWPMTIHRPSSIIREDNISLDLTHNLLHYSRLMKACPTSTNLQGFLDLVSLSNVVTATIKSLHENSPTKTRFVHHSGDIVIPLHNMKSFMSKELGEVVAELPIGEWTREARTLGMHEILCLLFENAANLGITRFPRVVKQGEGTLS